MCKAYPIQRIFKSEVKRASIIFIERLTYKVRISIFPLLGSVIFNPILIFCGETNKKLENITTD